MRTMLILAATVGLSFSVMSQADENQFGPLPDVKINAAKAELGKRLFFDTRLSGNTALSCASCHMPENGYSYPEALGPAYTGSKGFRNVPTLINTVYKKVWFHDGRIGTNLNDVTRENITEDWLMNMDMRLMQERLKQDPIYVAMFKEAGYGEPSNGSVRKAIPEYLKTLTSNQTPFDKDELNAAQQQGFDLFKGKAGCSSCHNGPLFSDGKPYNTGVPENLDIFRDPMRHQTFIAFNMFMGNENYMNLKRDVGAHVQTHKADGTDRGKFITPTLRELNQTAPYMHNGMISTLTDVVAFYNQGGGEDSNKDERITPLNLTWQEQKALVAFLESLSSQPLTSEQHVWKKSDYNYELISDWRNAKN
ncbi:putative methylamine utilization protein mauG [Vibrio tapetis subsp. tapetis]|uniref:Putative methylamine utilization protein mauG n=2 Tax=Vibrio tapetis TaxID=52443 RepID=A0A2N8ZLP4_9VIBR|nr:putative methylamine utilization protein mauG [Vibrio tapetis subsp. tapetis]